MNQLPRLPLLTSHLHKCVVKKSVFRVTFQESHSFCLSIAKLRPWQYEARHGHASVILSVGRWRQVIPGALASASLVYLENSRPVRALSQTKSTVPRLSSDPHTIMNALHPHKHARTYTQHTEWQCEFLNCHWKLTSGNLKSAM